MTKYFRVKIGFGKDDFISIPETSLATAIRAQVTGKVGIFDEGTVSGNHIIAIIPDYNRHLGLHRDYELNGRDYEEIGAKTVAEYRIDIERASQDVMHELGVGSNDRRLIGN